MQAEKHPGRELGSPGLWSIDLVWPTVTSELEVHFPKCLQEKQDHDFAALSPKTLATKQGLFPDHVFIHQSGYWIKRWIVKLWKTGPTSKFLDEDIYGSEKNVEFKGFWQLKPLRLKLYLLKGIGVSEHRFSLLPWGIFFSHAVSVLVQIMAAVHGLLFFHVMTRNKDWAFSASLLECRFAQVWTQQIHSKSKFTNRRDPTGAKGTATRVLIHTCGTHHIFIWVVRLVTLHHGGTGTCNSNMKVLIISGQAGGQSRVWAWNFQVISCIY